jgi:hypothetical protein
MDLHHTKPEPEVVSIAQAAAGLAMVSLVLLGIMGTIYKLVAPEGWLAQAFGRSLSAGAVTVGALLLLGACAWHSAGSPRRQHKLSDAVVYGFAGAGALYAARWLFTGDI